MRAPEMPSPSPSAPPNGLVPEAQDYKESTTGPSRLSQVWKYLNDDVRARGLAEVELLILTFCIGVQDAVSFPDFHCFASNQTGNTVFLMLALVMPEMSPAMFITANIGVALGFFLAAAWLTGQLGNIIGARRRLWLIFCNLVQTALVFGAAALQYSTNAASYPDVLLEGSQQQSAGGSGVQGVTTLYAIALLASAAGSQVVQSRSLRMTEITTAMATAAWVDLLIDPNLYVLRGNRSRNRRAAFLALLVLGTTAGAFIFKTVGSPAALVVSGAGKTLVTVMFFFNGAEGDNRAAADGADDSV